MLAAGLLVVPVSLFVAFRRVVAPIATMTRVMALFAEGDKTVDIAGTGERNEIGDMARAVEVFKINMIEADRLRGAREAEKARAMAEQKAALRRMADEFAANVGEVVDTVACSSTEMQGAAELLSGTAEAANQRATAAAVAATQTTSNVQIVAAAAEELSASIAEISRQVARSSEIASAAVEAARRTNDTVQSLVGGAQKIG